jgi:hypothetical protein
LEKLYECVAEVEDEHATEAVQLSWPVMEIFDALVDLGDLLAVLQYMMPTRPLMDLSAAMRHKRSYDTRCSVTN